MKSTTKNIPERYTVGIHLHGSLEQNKLFLKTAIEKNIPNSWYYFHQSGKTWRTENSPNMTLDIFLKNVDEKTVIKAMSGRNDKGYYVFGILGIIDYIEGFNRKQMLFWNTPLNLEARVPEVEKIFLDIYKQPIETYPRYPKSEKL